MNRLSDSLATTNRGRLLEARAFASNGWETGEKRVWLGPQAGPQTQHARQLGVLDDPLLADEDGVALLRRRKDADAVRQLRRRVWRWRRRGRRGIRLHGLGRGRISGRGDRCGGGRGNRCCGGEWRVLRDTQHLDAIALGRDRDQSRQGGRRLPSHVSRPGGAVEASSATHLEPSRVASSCSPTKKRVWR